MAICNVRVRCRCVFDIKKGSKTEFFKMGLHDHGVCNNNKL